MKVGVLSEGEVTGCRGTRGIKIEPGDNVD